LGEITSLTLAVPNKTSLRTTVPMSIVKQFDLSVSDKLDWSFEARAGELIIVVRPIKREQS
jgi:hypothetical protein